MRFSLLLDELGNHMRWLSRNRFAISFDFFVDDFVPFSRESRPIWLVVFQRCACACSE
jgi:hypothetical protein